MVGRAVTAQYMPTRPSYESRLESGGEEEGFQGPSNTWPIQLLENGDIYVADGYGKIKDGTLIGDRLGTDIFSRSQNGVILNGSVRDVTGLKEIEGWNHYIRGTHPSFIQDMMLEGVNVPIRIGDATVLPGDVVLAQQNAVVFIPPHLAREVVEEAEITILTDRFAKVRTEQGVYTSSQMDTGWTQEIKDDFYSWLEENQDELSVPNRRIQEIIDERLID
jgi:regulator of RNase E activity RraA